MYDALQVLIDECWQGRRWVVETDIANCFEAIPVDRVIMAVEERVSDRHVLKLLRAMLRAGVMADGLVRVDAGQQTVTEAGRPFVRVVAAAFDAYLQPGAARHSHAV